MLSGIYCSNEAGTWGFTKSNVVKPENPADPPGLELGSRIYLQFEMRYNTDQEGFMGDSWNELASVEGYYLAWVNPLEP